MSNGIANYTDFRCLFLKKLFVLKKEAMIDYPINKSINHYLIIKLIHQLIHPNSFSSVGQGRSRCAGQNALGHFSFFEPPAASTQLFDEF